VSKEASTKPNSSSSSFESSVLLAKKIKQTANGEGGDSPTFESHNRIGTFGPSIGWAGEELTTIFLGRTDPFSEVKMPE
jgi:hypothetical protein